MTEAVGLSLRLCLCFCEQLRTQVGQGAGEFAFALRCTLAQLADDAAVCKVICTSVTCLG